MGLLTNLLGKRVKVFFGKPERSLGLHFVGRVKEVDGNLIWLTEAERRNPEGSWQMSVNDQVINTASSVFDKIEILED